MGRAYPERPDGASFGLRTAPRSADGLSWSCPRVSRWRGTATAIQANPRSHLHEPQRDITGGRAPARRLRESAWASLSTRQRGLAASPRPNTGVSARRTACRGRRRHVPRAARHRAPRYRGRRTGGSDPGGSDPQPRSARFEMLLGPRWLALLTTARAAARASPAALPRRLRGTAQSMRPRRTRNRPEGAPARYAPALRPRLIIRLRGGARGRRPGERGA